MLIFSKKYTFYKIKEKERYENKQIFLIELKEIVKENIKYLK